MKKQQLIGFFFLLLSVAIVILALSGKTVIDRDITGMCITMPVGIYLIIARHDVFHGRDGPAVDTDKQAGAQAPRT